MSCITITSSGTTGDLLPFLALGKGLQACGHSVRMAVNPAAQAACQRAGLEFAPCGQHFGPEEARRMPGEFDAWSFSRPGRVLDDWESPGLSRRVEDLLAACRGQDLLIASSTQFVAYMVHEITGLPWLLTSLTLLVQTDDSEEARRRSAADPREAHQAHNAVREAVGLPAFSLDDWPEYVGSDHLLLGYSRHFCELPAMEFPCARQAGFWFHDDHQGTDWKPPSDLRAFAEADPAPLVLSLGSMPVLEPAQEVAVHAEAAARLGRRLVIQKGWANLSPSDLPASVDPRMVCFAEYVPHDWLFRHASALIHHGGIGTTARALCHGLPMLVEPRAFDQFVNARRILAVGLGAAAHPHKLTAEGLCRLLSEKVLTPEARRNAEAMGSRIQKENSVAVACNLIEKRLRNQPWD